MSKINRLIIQTMRSKFGNSVKIATCILLITFKVISQTNLKHLESSPGNLEVKRLAQNDENLLKPEPRTLV